MDSDKMAPMGILFYFSFTIARIGNPVGCTSGGTEHCTEVAS